MKDLTFEFKDEYRGEALKFFNIFKKERGVSYIAGWVCFISEDVEIEQMTRELITFKFRGHIHNAKQEYIDRITYTKIEIGEDK